MTRSTKSLTVVASVRRDDDAGALELGSLLAGFARASKGCRFEIPTRDPDFLMEAYGDRYQVWPLAMGVARGAFGVFGMPTIRSAGRTSLSLVTGAASAPRADLLAFLALARVRRWRVVGWWISLPDAERRLRPSLARWMFRNWKAIVAADPASEERLRRLGLTATILCHADPKAAAADVSRRLLDP